MSAFVGPGSAGAGLDGGSSGNTGATTGRGWLAALPGELAAQRRVMAGLVGPCEAWPLATSLLVGCSLGRGAADALSDIDAALGVDAAAARPAPGRCRPWKRWSWRRCRSSARSSTCCGTRLGPADQTSGGSSPSSPTARSSTWRSWPRPSEAPPRRRRPGLRLAVPGAPGSGSRPPGPPATAQAADEPPAAYAVTGEQVREWAFLGWCALIDADKYLRRGSLWEAHSRLHEARHHIWALWAAATRRPVPMARPVAGARPRPAEPAAGHRVHRRRARRARTCAAPRAPVPNVLTTASEPPPGGIRPTSRRRWPATSPMPFRAAADRLLSEAWIAPHPVRERGLLSRSARPATVGNYNPPYRPAGHGGRPREAGCGCDNARDRK